MKNTAPTLGIEKKIFVLRGHRVMLDRDLAELYGISVKVLNQAVKRNLNRFPDDFMFQLSIGEGRSLLILRSQFVTLRLGHGQHTKYAPRVFTEHGAIMLANIIKSPRAIQTSIHIVRAFVTLRQTSFQEDTETVRLKTLEQKMEQQDADIKMILEILHQLLKPTPPAAPLDRPFGFYKQG